MPRTRRRRAVDTPQAVAEDRMRIEYLDIDDIAPYDNNPRDNEDAVESVANSIEAFGFRVPITVDNDDVIVTGHTRYAAARRLGLTSVPVIRMTDMTPEQAKQFRIADNKVSEIATWRTDLLQAEFQAMQDMGIDIQVFQGLGYTAEELDCLADVVEDDCLSATGFMSDDEQQRARGVQARAPTQARIVISEFVFFIPMDAYRNWANQIRTECSFSEQNITAELQRRLGMDEFME